MKRELLSKQEVSLWRDENGVYSEPKLFEQAFKAEALFFDFLAELSKSYKEDSNIQELIWQTHKNLRKR